MDDALRDLATFQAVVFDLDGTLVRLRVDWIEARRAMVAHLQEATGAPPADRTVWGLLRATQGPLRAEMEAILTERELRGADGAERLPAAALLRNLTHRRRGVVTLNARAAAERALDRTGLGLYVEVLVAREDVARIKPDPTPLRRCLELLETEPSHAVFVGDRERDRETAERAGTAYRSVHDLPDLA